MRPTLQLTPPAVLLFVLPFTHTVALRLLALSLTAAAAVWIWRQGETAPPLPLKLPIALWAAVALLSLFTAVDPYYSLKEIKNEVVYTMIAFVSFFVLARGKRELNVLLAALLLSALVMAVMGIGARLYYGYWNNETYQGGVGMFSTYVVVVLPYLVFHIVTMKGALSRMFGMAVIVLAVVAAYFTLNRAFWPAFAVEVVVVFGFLFYRSARSIQRRLAVVITGCAFAVLVAGGSAFMHVVEAKRPQASSLEQVVGVLETDVRLPFWEATANVLGEHIWSGGGFGRHTFTESHPELRYLPGLWHAHNIVLNYWVQMGLPGVLALGLLLGAMAYQFWRFYRIGNNELAWLGACGIAMLAGFLVKNMTDDFFVRHMSLLFWSLTGISLGYGMRIISQRAA